MPPLLAGGVEQYLFALQSSQDLCNNLANAALTPLRRRPIFDGLWSFQADADKYPASVADFIRGQNWNYKSPLDRIRSNRAL
jgi:hypothetical protein